MTMQLLRILALALCGSSSALRATRRSALLAPVALATPVLFPAAVVAESGPLPTGRKPLLALVEEARRQLDAVPALVANGKWDSVRVILATPPLYDCWGKNPRPLLRNFAEAVGADDGDELAALEAREDAVSHLRYLDMAVYNNVFSPAGQADAGAFATKELVKQYDSMPREELKLATKALDDLVSAGTLK